MNRQQIIERLKKLKALKERGDGGEALNAERLFTALCHKHNISPDSFDDDDIQVDHAVVGGSHEYAEILSQIVWKRVGREPDRVRHLSPEMCKRMKKSERKLLDEAYGVKGWDMLITCTDAEFVQVMFEWEILKQNYDERKQAFMFAFLDKNDLLLEPTDDAENLRANSEAHARLAREASFYSAFMQKADVRKALKD